MDEFEITEDHLKLVRKMHMGWNEDCFGAPGLDCKRPYGDSWVYGDLAEYLGIEPEDPERGFTPDEKMFMYNVWRDTQTVLQILIDNLDSGIKVGKVYKQDSDTGKWVFSFEMPQFKD